jgi:hypothetical protein
LMILGAVTISTAVVSSRENVSNNLALARECERYGLDYSEVLAAQSGNDLGASSGTRRWWDVAIVVAASGIFVALGIRAVVPPLAMNMGWLYVLTAALIASLLGAGWALWRNTRFS